MSIEETEPLSVTKGDWEALTQHAKEGWEHAHRWRSEYDSAVAVLSKLKEAEQAVKLARDELDVFLRSSKE